MTQPTSIDWTKIKALTFDIYGTLVDWDAGVIRAARATALGPYLPSGDEFLSAVEKHHARIEREQPRMRKSDINAEGLRAYATDLKLLEQGKLTEEEIEQAAKQFGGSIGGFEAFDDTVSVDDGIFHRVHRRTDTPRPGRGHPALVQALQDPRASDEHGPCVLQRHPVWPSQGLPVHDFLHRRRHRFLQAGSRELPIPLRSSQG